MTDHRCCPSQTWFVNLTASLSFWFEYMYKEKIYGGYAYREIQWEIKVVDTIYISISIKWWISHAIVPVIARLLWVKLIKDCNYNVINRFKISQKPFCLTSSFLYSANPYQMSYYFRIYTEFSGLNAPLKNRGKPIFHNLGKQGPTHAKFNVKYFPRKKTLAKLT